MLRSHRSLARLATLSAILVTAPVASRLSAQTLAPSADTAVVTQSTVAATSAPTIDLSAPSVAPAAPTATVTSSSTGASMTGLRSAAHRTETQRAFIPAAAATNANLGQARAMMVVGAAALITGAIIGDTPGTFIMVGGAVIGLYGLYQYLQ